MCCLFGLPFLKAEVGVWWVSNYPHIYFPSQIINFPMLQKAGVQPGVQITSKLNKSH